MDFEHIPELQSRFGYPAVPGLMALVAGGLPYCFRRKGWWSCGSW
jgi:magnesium transporter